MFTNFITPAKGRSAFYHRCAASSVGWGKCLRIASEGFAFGFAGAVADGISIPSRAIVFAGGGQFGVIDPSCALSIILAMKTITPPSS
ncbi:hypothetical protein [Burkholderia plantarii]|uniref:hypothetical protein n=1 Tax=Burkholderia plantarii TaxID=41899 RepID=UPI0013923AC8|nr:hypothetical protein [Burkholderia plantarii]